MMTLTEINSPVGNANSYLFFVLYTIFRVILLPFIAWKHWKTVVSVWPYLNDTRKFSGTIGIIQLAALTIMSYYWYYGLLKVLGKMLGLIDKKSKEEDLMPWRKIGE